MKRVSMLTSNFAENNEKSKRRKADDVSASSSSATSTRSNNYDVFLSFRGEDTRNTFVDHLYNGLVDAGICVFRDDDELCEGEKIDTNLLQAIKNSKISIPILSHNYASSKWCLRELIQMTECMKSSGHVILPIFYRVEPADVRYQKGPFGETFSHCSGKYSEEEVAKWKQALQEVACLTGWVSERTANGREGELVKLVVRKVLSELKKAFQLVVTEQIVGIDNAVEDVLRLLDDYPSATQIVGIHGMGGIGKTTLAKVVYNKLFDKFQHRSFIADIRESSQRKGISCLQNQLMHDILGIEDQMSNTDEGIRILETRFTCKKVLILLDDVDDYAQLKALVGKRDWFESGSRIIITTRIRYVLDYAGVNCQYELKEIPVDQSLILFSRHAFRRDSPLCGFESLSNDVVSTTGGLPLALEVIGSFLCGKNQAFWQDALKKLKKAPHEKVQEKLRISYDALNYEEQQIFLDIACFFIGTNVRIASYMWDACNFFPTMGIEILSFMSLIKVGDRHELKMHDQLRDLGREIARQEDYDVPMNRSRLWAYEEALEALRINKGGDKVRVQALRLEETSSPSEITTQQFETLPNLRFLQVRNAKVIGDSKSLLPKLRWLVWSASPAFVASSCHLEKLVILDLSNSDVSEVWEGWSHLKVAKQLKVLKLEKCLCLKITPNLSAFQNLEILVLRNCANLVQIHPSIGEVKSLVSLNLRLCKKLQELPEEIGKLEELKELTISSTAIRKIPPCIGYLKKLEMLSAPYCKSLVELPDSTNHLVNSSTLKLSSGLLYRPPERIKSPVKLQCLQLSGTRSHVGESDGGDHLHDPVPNDYCCYLPNSIWKLELLTKLCLSYTSIQELPESIGDLKNLRILSIRGNKKLSSLPSTISKLGKLEVLNAQYCESLEGEIPIDGLSSLKILKLSGTGLSGFPDAFDKLSHLQNLDLKGCKMLESLPQSISKLCSLEHLESTNCDKLQSLPKFPASLTVLRVTCQYHLLPQLSHLIRLKELTVGSHKLELRVWSYHNLKEFPELPPTLIVLNVTGQYRMLPQLSHLIHLKELTVKCCQLESMPELPSGIGKLRVSEGDKLRELPELPVTLRVLEVTGQYRTLPQLSHLSYLKELTVWNCPFLESMPEFPLGILKLRVLSCGNLKELPSLSSLEFLSELDLNFCRKLMEIKGLEALKSLAKLKVCECRELSNLNDLEHLESLRCFDVSLSSGSDTPLAKDNIVQVQCLGSLKNLEELNICGHQSLRRLDLLQLTHLKRLRVTRCCNLVEIKGLDRLKNLEELDIKWCTSIEALPDLSCFNNMKILHIRGCWKLRGVLEKFASEVNAGPIGKDPANWPRLVKSRPFEWKKWQSNR